MYLAPFSNHEKSKNEKVRQREREREREKNNKINGRPDRVFLQFVFDFIWAKIKGLLTDANERTKELDKNTKDVILGRTFHPF